MELRAAVGSGPVALDTAPFIYFIEQHPRFGPLVRHLLDDADRGVRLVVTSAVTLLEVLVVPYRAGDVTLAERYEALLTRSRGLRLVGLDRAQLKTAAQIRAAYRARTPDALQLAAALTQRCSAFVTDDRAMPAVPGLRILQLSEYAGQ
ncbi:MAG: PIN domain-containing protein [Gemmatimonadales bacterium]